jgi:hypothetical protein
MLKAEIQQVYEIAREVVREEIRKALASQVIVKPTPEPPAETESRAIRRKNV